MATTSGSTCSTSAGRLTARTSLLVLVGAACALLFAGLALAQGATSEPAPSPLDYVAQWGPTGGSVVLVWLFLEADKRNRREYANALELKAASERELAVALSELTLAIRQGSCRFVGEPAVPFQGARR